MTLVRYSMAKKTSAEQNRTTPHLPVVFGSQSFSVGNFYKRPRQPAPLLGRCSQVQTEKSEKNFSFFQ